MPIRVLPPEIANRIAAGEVVERPASVVKELIENAIDAGAREIQVELQEGGRRLIRVTDDGSGFTGADAELAFARHATSKLTRVEDLDHIATLGFRGEALASIAAVSRLTLSTRSKDEEVGIVMELEGGELVRQAPVGRPAGTGLTVEHLFFNVPARLKFLRTPATEAGHVSELVMFYALAYPSLRFKLVHNGRVAFRSDGGGDLRDVLVSVFGVEVARELLEIDSEWDEERLPGPRISGYVSPPAVNRANRQHMTFFVNGRWIRDRSLSYAVLQAYHTLLPTGRFPISVVRIDMDAAEVDVNVHPTKSEVRFREPGKIFGAVQRQVRAALIERAPAPEINPWKSSMSHDLPPSQESAGWDWQRRQRLVNAGRAQAELALGAIPPAERQPSDGHTGAGLPILRVVGQARQMYIIAEGPDGLYLIDQHAAHERVLYEQMRSQRATAQAASQQLLEAQVVNLDAPQHEVLSEYLDQLQAVGFDLEPFGERSVLLRAAPASLANQADLHDMLPSILEDLRPGERPLSREEDASVMAAVCKRAAIKAGQTLSHSEMVELVRQLEATISPRTCPHGRPTMIHLSADLLGKQFLRA
jgi:DNA mismatch repair protein MutL